MEAEDLNAVAGAEDAAEPLQGSTVTLVERESRWGFTLPELQIATKVVRTLFSHPSLFVGDPYLAESRLYTMITRDRKTKKENREVYKKIMNEEKSRRRRYQRLQDMEAVRKTTMKREREETLQLLLEPRSPAPLLLCQPGDEGAPSRAQEGEEGESSSATAAHGTDVSQWSEEEKALFRCVGAFENLVRLEEAGQGRYPAELGVAGDGLAFSSSLASPAIPPEEAESGKEVSECSPRKRSFAPDHLQAIVVSQLTAQVYRYLPHEFGTQMPPPLLCGAAPAGLPALERCGYIVQKKLEIAEMVHRLQQIAPLPFRSPIEGPEGGFLSAALRCGADVVLYRPLLPVPDADTDRVTAMRSFVAALHTGDPAAWGLAAAVPVSEISAEMLLRRLAVVLREGGTDDIFNYPHSGTPSEWSPAQVALETLDWFIQRRLGGLPAVREAGPSPVYIDCCPPTSDSQEPETYSVFDDLQVYAHETASEEMLQVSKWIGCYTCKVRYRLLHPYYYSMCHLCGEFNYNKRLMTADLRGKNVLLTGCRIKIGFAMALSLLRCGATLLGTTRFAHEALARFQAEKDYDVWRHRLHLFSLDLRDMWVTTQFCFFVRQYYGKLYAIINNAAQTISRTPAYTAHLRALEQQPPPALQEGLCRDARASEWHQFFLKHSTVHVGVPLSLESGDGQRRLTEAPMTSAPSTALPPTPFESSPPCSAVATVTSTSTGSGQTMVFDRYDTVAEEGDGRETNSWMMKLGEVSGGEVAEVMAINALSPFILNSRLKPCLLHREGDEMPGEPRFIINVSAMEGQFYRFKQTTHPHTNMAKAALNMMSRTSGADYAADGIYMNSVDTGWITDESPKAKKERRAEQYMLCPLDEVDAAARCLDLIYVKSREYGKFYKDFKEIPW